MAAELQIVTGSMSSSTTFQVFDINPEIYKQSGFPSAKAKLCESEHVVTLLDQYKENNCTRVLSGTKFSRKTRPAIKNGLVSTVLNCYAGHHNLVIRPEDIWIAIITQFSLYINANAEDFRGKFVDFDKKKKLRVTTEGNLFSGPYDVLIDMMAEKIHENVIDKELKSWILPNFTTTTQDDIITSGAILMATMKNYFSYAFGFTCGIPKITLEGTTSDYRNILLRLEKLKSYKLEKWFDMLHPILTQFVEAKNGNVDMEFWQRIVNINSGCGAPDSISGWISVFCAFDFNGKWQGDNYYDYIESMNKSTDEFYDAVNKSTDGIYKIFGQWPTISFFDIPSSVTESEVIIDNHGEEFKSLLFAGHMAFELLDDNVSLRPKSGWAIALKNTEKINHKFACRASEEKQLLGHMTRNKLSCYVDDYDYVNFAMNFHISTFHLHYCRLLMSIAAIYIF